MAKKAKKNKKKAAFEDYNKEEESRADNDEQDHDGSSEVTISDAPKFKSMKGEFLRLENISKIFPRLEVLKDVTWEVKPGERVGLVGANGAGKTTQLKIILGMEEPTSGTLYMPDKYRISYLTQEFEVDPRRTVKEEFWQAFARALQVQDAIAEVEEQMAKASMAELDKLIHEMDVLQREADGIKIHEMESRIQRMMPQLGFTEEDGDRLVSSFSGGWQMRMSLGKILLQEPDLLLLDEPTNHIDLDTIEWLEEYLKSRQCAMVIVSHDREFMDNICTRIVEVERGISTVYNGNYTKYLQQKEDNRLKQQAAYERQQKEIQKQKAFIAKFSASAARGSQAKSREKMLAKMDTIVPPPYNPKTIHFTFPEPPRSGREVIIIKDLHLAYGQKVLFTGANLVVERGDKIAFVGPNGAGKSTLLEVVMGLRKPDKGSAKIGDHSIFPSYFAQNQAEAMDLERTALETLLDTNPKWKHEDMRALLGKFMFKGDAVNNKVKNLSGGEKARLALARILMTTCNCLILDEPTNHVDIPGKEVLEQAIMEFDGTLLVVSHDRYFISKVANKIVEIRDGKLRVYLGDYKYYLEKIAEERSSGTLPSLAMYRRSLADAEADEQAARERQLTS